MRLKEKNKSRNYVNLKCGLKYYRFRIGKKLKNKILERKIEKNIIRKYKSNY